MENVDKPPPDISMCNGGECPLKKSCYRFTTTPSDYQAYCDFSQDLKEEVECKYYWPNEEDGR